METLTTDNIVSTLSHLIDTHKMSQILRAELLSLATTIASAPSIGRPQRPWERTLPAAYKLPVAEIEALVSDMPKTRYRTHLAKAHMRIKVTSKAKPSIFSFIDVPDSQAERCIELINQTPTFMAANAFPHSRGNRFRRDFLDAQRGQLTKAKAKPAEPEVLQPVGVVTSKDIDVSLANAGADRARQAMIDRQEAERLAAAARHVGFEVKPTERVTTPKLAYRFPVVAPAPVEAFVPTTGSELIFGAQLRAAKA